jgi:5'-3' exoribonuclease 1
MSRDDSPVSDFYPKDFKIDMNGKKNDWEAVVVVPFIDEKRLLHAAKGQEHLLNEEEITRNGL